MQRSYSPADVSVCAAYWSKDGYYLDVLVMAQSVQEHYPVAEISLCDDGSRYRDFEIPGATVTRLPEKPCALNPCSALNAAVKASTRSVIVLTNPGTIFRAGMLERLLSELTSNGYVAAACCDADSGRWLCHSTVKGGEHGRGPMPAGSGFHFCAMFTRALWDKAGGFDEDYREGQGYDDNDFLWRLHAVGATFKVTDDVVVQHKRSTTQWPAGGLERNRALFIRKWSKAA